MTDAETANEVDLITQLHKAESGQEAQKRAESLIRCTIQAAEGTLPLHLYALVAAYALTAAYVVLLTL